MPEILVCPIDKYMGDVTCNKKKFVYEIFSYIGQEKPVEFIVYDNIYGDGYL